MIVIGRVFCLLHKEDINMLDIDRKILTIDKAICRHLAEADYSNRGMISQDILSHLRNLVEHLMLKCYAGR